MSTKSYVLWLLTVSVATSILSQGCTYIVCTVAYKKISSSLWREIYGAYYQQAKATLHRKGIFKAYENNYCSIIKAIPLQL